MAEKSWRVRVGKCAAMMSKLPPGSASLVIADPPYNRGMQYEAFDDKLTPAQYLDATLQWMSAATEVLGRHGSMWVFAPDDWVSEIDVMAKKEFGFTKQNHVVWYFTFGQAAKQRFTKSHCHLLWLSKSVGGATFNAEAMRVPSARQAVYNDKRSVAAGKMPDSTWVLHRKQLEPLFAPDMDVWLESRVCGTFDERSKISPNQIPLPIMERIVLATSSPGDLVVDPFLGSGTAGVAAVRHGRRYEGFDVSKACVAASSARIKAAEADAAARAKTLFD